MCALRHWDGFWAHWGWFRSLLEEGRLEEEKRKSLRMKEAGLFLWCGCIHSTYTLCLQLQPVAALPRPSAWWDSDCPPLRNCSSVQSHSWERWNESFQDFWGKCINNNKKQKPCNGQQRSHHISQSHTSVGGSTPRRSAYGVCSAGKSRRLPRLLRCPVTCP